MYDVTHYARRPVMPLPTEMLTAVNADLHLSPGSWNQLTDAERDLLWELFPPVVTVAMYHTGDGAQLVTVAPTAPRAVVAVERAAAAHLADGGGQPGRPVDEAADVLTGQLGTVWRDGDFYPKVVD